MTNNSDWRPCCFPIPAVSEASAGRAARLALLQRPLPARRPGTPRRARGQSAWRAHPGCRRPSSLREQRGRPDSQVEPNCCSCPPLINLPACSSGLARVDGQFTLLSLLHRSLDVIGFSITLQPSGSTMAVASPREGATRGLARLGHAAACLSPSPRPLLFLLHLLPHDWRVVGVRKRGAFSHNTSFCYSVVARSVNIQLVMLPPVDTQTEASGTDTTPVSTTLVGRIPKR